MTVAKQIAALAQLPADARVILPHFYGGFVDVTSAHLEPVRRTVAKTMADAAYDGANPLDEGVFAPDETAAAISSD